MPSEDDTPRDRPRSRITSSEFMPSPRGWQAVVSGGLVVVGAVVLGLVGGGEYKELVSAAMGAAIAAWLTRPRI